jgi:hypothetical protein
MGNDRTVSCGTKPAGASAFLPRGTFVIDNILLITEGYAAKFELNKPN